MPARPLLAALAALTLSGSLAAQGPVLQQLIEKGRHPAIRWGRFSDVQSDVRRLYLKSGWAPLWLALSRATTSAHAVIEALATAADHGLDPEDYDAAQLTALAATLDRGGADAEQALRFDLALTIASLRFVSAVARGRVPPDQANLRAGTPSIDAVATVEQLRRTAQPGPVFSALEPPWSQYRVLRRALARYRALAGDSTLRLPRPARNDLREGSQYEGAERLRRLLGALGDLDPRAAEPRVGDSALTAGLVEGIRHFQLRQGTHVDGLLNEATWRLFTTHLPLRIRQITLALERWRWLPREPQGPPLWVSLPAMRAHYFISPERGEHEPVSMRVGLGSEFPKDRPVLAGALNMLAFHPSSSQDVPGRVVFPVDRELYLHGTIASPGARSAPGGIAVADGELLAELLLRGRAGWIRDRMQAVMTRNKPLYVRLERSVPVIVVYATAVARENGQVFFYPDVQRHDRRLELELARGYPYR